MREFEYEPVDPKRTLFVVMIAFVISVTTSLANDLSGGALFIIQWFMFALGWSCVFAIRRETARERLAWEQFEESDWRFFEHFREMSGTELEELRALSKTPVQRRDAVAFLTGRFGVSPAYADSLHEFFVRSGWADRNEISDEWLGYAWPSLKMSEQSQ